MSLRHAILGFLQVMPMTGYDLKTQAFDHTVAHFWRAAQQQIYRELDKMTAHGWVRHELEMQVERPSKKIYHITEAGRQELADWLHQEHGLASHKEAFLIQLFFAAQLSNDDIIALLRSQLTGHRQRLATLAQIRMPPPQNTQHQRQQMLAGLTLELGLRTEQMYITWLEEAIATVQECRS